MASSINPALALTAWVVLGLSTACTTPSATPSANSIAMAGPPFEEQPGVTVIAAEQLPDPTVGQVIYVPIYSEIYNFDQNRTFQLTATLSIRNTDLERPIVIETIDYYNSGGDKVKAYLSQPIQLAPLVSTAVVVDRDDTSGGSGANFILAWRADAAVSPPVVEAIMVNTDSQQGVSFVSPGRVIEREGAPQGDG
ncbi:MAG: DUF3124 domain-containing protein [Nodosilinea sp.]